MRRDLLTIALVVALLWDFLIVATLVSSIGDRDPTLIVYLASAAVVCAWGIWLWIRRRRARREYAALPAVVFAAASVLGPLAFLLLALRRVRAAAFAHEPLFEPGPELVVKPSVASSVYAAPSAQGSVSVYQPSSVYARPSRPRRPTLTLTWQLILAVLAFPVALVLIAAMMVLGEAVFTPRVIWDIALGAAIVSGGAIVLVAYRWHSAISGTEKTQSRLPGAAMIGTAAILVIAGAAYLGTTSAPKNLGSPSISGSPQVNALLTAEPGRWNEPKPSLYFSYQWESCDTSCEAILDATERTYVVAKADLGKRIRVAVEADTNSPGWHELASGLAYSSKTGRVTR